MAGRASGAIADFTLGSGGRGLASVSVGLDIPYYPYRYNPYRGTGIILILVKYLYGYRMRCHTGTRLIKDAA